MKNPDFKIGANWTLRKIVKKLPLGGCQCGRCDCSADMVYIISEIRKLIDKMK